MSELTTKVLIQIQEKLSGMDTELKGHAVKLDEHGAILTEHGAILREHGAILREHGAILREHGQAIQKNTDAIDELRVDMTGELRANGQVLKQILGAVEYGNRQRDIRVEDIEERVSRIEDHLELPAEG